MLTEAEHRRASEVFDRADQRIGEVIGILSQIGIEGEAYHGMADSQMGELRTLRRRVRTWAVSARKAAEVKAAES